MKALLLLYLLLLGGPGPALLAVVGLVLFIWFEPALARRLGAWRRMRTLRRELTANPANVKARRELAGVYLDAGRPASTLTVLAPALERDPDSAELLFLQGAALHRLGRHEDALAPLVAATEGSPRLYFGETYRVAGDALVSLGRWEAAQDAYERCLAINSSSIDALLALARVHRRQSRAAAASAQLREARATLRFVPGFWRRLRATLRVQWHLARHDGDAGAAASLAGATLAVLLAASLCGLAAGAASRTTESRYTSGRPCAYESGACGLRRAIADCGSVRIPPGFHGSYRSSARPEVSYRVTPDRLLFGHGQLWGELCFLRVRALGARTLRITALQRDDVGEPGGASVTSLVLERVGNGRLRLTFPDDAGSTQPLLLQRAPP